MSLLCMIIPVFIRPFIRIYIKPKSRHYCFSKRLSHKGVFVKTYNFYFNRCDVD